jgi:hypothetical protein
MQTRTRLVLAAACAVAVLPVPTALAKAPPAGKYDCTIGGSTLFGVLTIKKNGDYRHRGSQGTYRAKGRRVTFQDGVRGWRISFKGGTLAGVKGRWYKGLDGTPEGSYEIALKNPRDDFESIYCGKRK